MLCHFIWGLVTIKCRRRQRYGASYFNGFFTRNVLKDAFRRVAAGCQVWNCACFEFLVLSVCFQNSRRLFKLRTAEVQGGKNETEKRKELTCCSLAYSNKNSDAERRVSLLTFVFLQTTSLLKKKKKEAFYVKTCLKNELLKKKSWVTARKKTVGGLKILYWLKGGIESLAVEPAPSPFSSFPAMSL